MLSKCVFVVESLEPRQRKACKNTAEHKEVPELSQQKSLYTPDSAINDSKQIQGCCRAFLEWGSKSWNQAGRRQPSNQSKNSRHIQGNRCLEHAYAKELSKALTRLSQLTNQKSIFSGRDSSLTLITRYYELTFNPQTQTIELELDKKWKD